MQISVTADFQSGRTAKLSGWMKLAIDIVQQEQEQIDMKKIEKDKKEEDQNKLAAINTDVLAAAKAGTKPKAALKESTPSGKCTGSNTPSTGEDEFDKKLFSFMSGVTMQGGVDGSEITTKVVAALAQGGVNTIEELFKEAKVFNEATKESVEIRFNEKTGFSFNDNLSLFLPGCVFETPGRSIEQHKKTVVTDYNFNQREAAIFCMFMKKKFEEAE